MSGMAILGIMIVGAFVGTIWSSQRLDNILTVVRDRTMSGHTTRSIESRSILVALSFAIFVGLVVAAMYEVTERAAIDTISKTLNKPIIREEVITTNVIYRIAVEE